MAKTNDLKQKIKNKITAYCQNTFYEEATNKSLYPRVVFNFDTSSPIDNRDDVTFTIDIWDKASDSAAIEILTDNLESAFRNSNDPTSTILPTFYVISRNRVKDEDISIKHRVIRVLCQNYERS